MRSDTASSLSPSRTLATARPRGAVEVEPSSRGKLSRVKVTASGEGEGEGSSVAVSPGCWQAARDRSRAADAKAASSRFVFMSCSSLTYRWMVRVTAAGQKGKCIEGGQSGW